MHTSLGNAQFKKNTLNEREIGDNYFISDSLVLHCTYLLCKISRVIIYF